MTGGLDSTPDDRAVEAEAETGKRRDQATPGGPRAREPAWATGMPVVASCRQATRASRSGPSRTAETGGGAKPQTAEGAWHSGQMVWSALCDVAGAGPWAGAVD